MAGTLLRQGINCLKVNKIVRLVSAALISLMSIVPTPVSADETDFHIYGENTLTGVGQPQKSNLYATDNGFVRIEHVGYANSDYENLNFHQQPCTIIEHLDNSYRPLSKKELSDELPLFGGVYIGKNSNFIVSGQENSNDDNSVETYRIIKYDKNWNRISSCSLYGYNTYQPFMGSVRFAEYGKYLYFSTAHTMYKSSDGFHHQANITVALDTESMKVTDAEYLVTYGTGYVSHSFNRFLAIDGKQLVTINLGDAYPRGLILYRYEDATNGILSNQGDKRPESMELMKFAGNIGDNYTGAELGEFSVTDNHYVIGGSSTSQKTGNEKTKNVFIETIDKNFANKRITWLTSFKEGEIGVSNVHMTELGEGRYLFMWEEDIDPYAGLISFPYNPQNVSYVIVDENGNLLSDIKEFKGNLNSCLPLVKNGHAYWYAFNVYARNDLADMYSDKDGEWISVNNIPYLDDNTVFFDIDLNTMEAKSTGWNVAMFRMYNPYSGEHLYTSSSTEGLRLTWYGWKYEGVGWYAPGESNTPVYRMYNPYSGDHHYTISSVEKNNMIKNGWKDEGVGWYSDDEKGVPLYRQFNPYVSVGAHNYTISKEENDYLKTIGWREEGVAWYGIRRLNDE